LKTNKAKIVATYIVVGGMIFIFLFDIAAVLLRNHLERRFHVAPETFQSQGQGARFHFLNVYNGDSILLESHGRFALIDAGWGSYNPIEPVRRPGTEDRVLDYLKRVAADEDGVVRLDFVLVTHYHYDHVGGIPPILSDPSVEVERVYLSPRSPDGQARWYIPIVRERVAQIALQRGFEVVEQLPTEPFSLGAMTVQFFNTDHTTRRVENDKSIVTLAKYGSFRALLTSDIQANRGVEREIARAVSGPVDLLQVPHHGYTLSTSAYFLRALRPGLAIVSNHAGRVYPNVMWNLTFVARVPYLSTVQENGIIVTANEDSQMMVTGDLHLP